MVMLAAGPLAGKVGTALAKKAIAKATGKKAPVKKIVKYRRRRVRLLTLGQREELTWIARHLGRTAAAERMVHYRR